MPEPPRLLIANLGWESELAGETTTQNALAAAAAFGTLLRVFARPGDTLHLPAPIAADRLPASPSLPRPGLVHGSLKDIAAASRILAWAESDAVARVRAKTQTLLEVREESGDFADRPWHFPVPTPTAAAAVHHRRFFSTVADDLGFRLPGSHWIGSIDEMENHLDDPASGASRSWVLKAPWSAAGRSRVLGTGPTLTATERRAVVRLLQRHSSLLFEPWMERQMDFGISAVVGERVEILSAHRLLVDSRGAFRGLESSACGTLEPWLPPPWIESVERAVLAVGAAAATAGYRGVFGVDGYTFLQGDRVFCQPLGEINARMTFGLIGRAALGALPSIWKNSSAARLLFGPGLPPDQRRNDKILPLLHPAPGTPGAIWVELVPKN